ncbi:hypothetical protein G6F68_015155 [Rhizopus microsporus]|nr:hypothetical protein G6F68_015155 [Rhizopus microsporus]
MTRLLGQSPGGLNASGESDLRNYYARISSNQELVLQPSLQILDECLIRSALGSRPPEVFYNWRSLWQTTDTERAAIGKTTAETIKTIAETKLLPDEVMSTVAVNMLTEAGVAPGLEAEMLDGSAGDRCAAALALRQPQGDERGRDRSLGEGARHRRTAGRPARHRCLLAAGLRLDQGRQRKRVEQQRQG